MFLNAVSKNELQLVQAFLNEGGNVEITDNAGLNALMLAASKNNIEIILELLKFGANVNAQCEKEPRIGLTALMLAARNHKVEAIKILLNYGADKSLKGPILLSGANTATMYAEQEVWQAADYEAVSILKNFGTLNDSFLNAVLQDSLEQIKELLDAGADINARNSKSETALMMAAKSGNLAIIDELLKRNADKNLTSESLQNNLIPRSALSYACLYGHTEAIRRLMQVGISKENQVTALSLCIKDDTPSALKTLIDMGADKNTVILGQITLLSTAIKAGNVNIIKVLIEANVDVHEFNDYAMISAARCHDSSEIIALLINAGANINAEEDFGTALEQAVGANHFNVVRTLLSAGANLISNRNHTALMTAAQHGNIQMLELLFESDGKTVIDVQEEYYSQTALMFAARANKLDAVKLLLQHGANKTLRNIKEQTAEIIASESNYRNVSLLLRNFGAFQDRLQKIRFDKNRLSKEDLDIFELITDPITLEIINDPVSISSGITYDRLSLEDLFKHAGNAAAIECPITKLPIRRSELNNKTHIITKNLINHFVSKQETTTLDESKSDIDAGSVSVSNVTMFVQTPLSNERPGKVAKNNETEASYLHK